MSIWSATICSGIPSLRFFSGLFSPGGPDMSTKITGCQLSDQDIAVRDLPWATDPRSDEKIRLWKYALDHHLLALPAVLDAADRQIEEFTDASAGLI